MDLCCKEWHFRGHFKVIHEGSDVFVNSILTSESDITGVFLLSVILE